MPLLLGAPRALSRACGDDGDSAAAPSRERLRVDRFDSAAAHGLLREQVELGPRPAGSRASRRLARSAQSACCRAAATRRCPGDSATWSGRVPGPRSGLRGARRALRHQGHPGLRGSQRRRVGHGGGRAARPHDQAAHVSGAPSCFVLFDGEESPRGTPDSQFARDGLQGQQGRGAALPGRARDGAARLRGRPAAAHPARGVLEPASSGAACARRRAGRAPGARSPPGPAATLARRPPAVPASRGCPRST